MANKTYKDFPAGTYDTSKIFLQADALTGELEKINLPAINSYYTNIYSNTIAEYNTGTVYNQIKSYTLPANTLAINNDRLELMYAGTCLIGTGSKEIQFIAFNHTATFNSLINARPFVIQLTLTRQTSNTMVLSRILSYNAVTSQVQAHQLPSIDFTTAQPIYLNVKATDPTSIVCFQGHINLIKSI